VRSGLALNRIKSHRVQLESTLAISPAFGDYRARARARDRDLACVSAMEKQPRRILRGGAGRRRATAEQVE